MSVSHDTFFASDEAYDPVRQPELYAGVLGKRVLAFLIDMLVLGFFELVALLVVVLLGFVTFGVGWMLFALPFFSIVAVLYAALTLGGPKSATPGMQLLGLTIRSLDGAPIGPMLAAAHLILYWVSLSLLTPLILVIALFSNRKRLLHDMLIGAVMINREPLLRMMR